MRRKTSALTVLACLASVGFAHAADICTTTGTPDNLKYVQYFLSRVQDTPGCAMRVEGGGLTVPPTITNPAMSCPDMFAWKLFIEAIVGRFWRNWAADQETWPGNGLAKDPGKPYPLCAPGQSGACCDPSSKTNPGYDDKTYKAKYCPYFPGDHNLATDAAPPRIGVPPSKAHTFGFAGNPRFREALKAEATLAQQILEGAESSKGRQVRQSMAEIVFRNKPFFDYVFKNDLYNTEGVVKVFNANAANIAGPGGASGAPYRIDDGDRALAEITFPPNAVMIKSDWLNKKRAEEIGLKEDPENPYVKMNIVTPVLDNNGVILEPGEHWLIAIHFSSKDIPNWVWTTFEHVNNFGRCDFTGCNDSYGYTSPDEVAAGQARNYTRPHIVCDGLLLPSYVLDPDRTYPGGARREELASIFRRLEIGVSDKSTETPQPADRAWLSYRLKGAQVDFADATGRPTHLGNSVTEAGFVTSSSCMTCHARAGATADGTVPLALGVFENGLTETGNLPSSNGLPSPDWYHKSKQPPALQVLQTDFVWGFLLANPIAPRLAAEGAFFGKASPLTRSIRERILGR